MSRSVGVLAHAAVPTRAESPGLSGRVGATLEQRYRGGAVSLRETQTHGCSEMLRRTTQHVNTKLLAAEIPCTTAGTGATIPLLEYYDGGDTFVPPRPRSARPATTYARGAAGGRPRRRGRVRDGTQRPSRIEDSPLSREFESTGDAVSTWDCSLYMG